MFTMFAMMDDTISVIFYQAQEPSDHAIRTLDITSSTTQESLLQELISLIPLGHRLVAAWVSWVDRDAPRIVTTTNLATMTDARFRSAMEDLCKPNRTDELFVEYDHERLNHERLTSKPWPSSDLEPLIAARLACPHIAKASQTRVLESQQQSKQARTLVGEQCF
jgi:hypothetical protein